MANLLRTAGVLSSPLGPANLLFEANSGGPGYTNPSLSEQDDAMLTGLKDYALRSPGAVQQDYMHGISSELPPMEEAKDFTGQALQRRAKKNLESRYNELNRAVGLHAQKDQASRLQNASNLMKQKLGGDVSANQLAMQAYHDRVNARSQALASLFGGMGQLGGMAMRKGNSQPQAPEQGPNYQPSGVY